MDHTAAQQIQDMIDRETAELRERIVKKDALLRLFVAYFDTGKTITPLMLEQARLELA